MCDAPAMIEVASRELRNNTRRLLRRVEAGEEVTITLDGRPVAVLRPVAARPRWMKGSDLFLRLSGHQSDPGLTKDLADLAPDTTDGVQDLRQE
jgi:prevent-host-death family protein